MNNTKIEWCDYTWNPAWGCKNLCNYCYARKIARRFGKLKAKKEYEYREIYNLKELENRLNNFIPTFLITNFHKKFPKKL